MRGDGKEIVMLGSTYINHKTSQIKKEIADLKQQLDKYTEPYAKIDITRPDTKNAGDCNNDKTVGRLADRVSIYST